MINRIMAVKTNHKNTPRKFLQTAFHALLLATIVPTQAHACACCAEPGSRSSGTEDIGDYMQAQLSRIEFSGPANTYTTACGLDCVLGIDNPQDSYQIALLKRANTWTFSYSDNARVLGSFQFELPAELYSFAIDTALDPAQYTATLYKELRLEVIPTGKGIFATAFNGKDSAELIFSGTGNECTSADDFAHWHFETNTATSDFTFYGDVTAKP